MRRKISVCRSVGWTWSARVQAFCSHLVSASTDKKEGLSFAMDESFFWSQEIHDNLKKHRET